MLSVINKIRLNINNRKITRYSPKRRKFQNTLVSNPWVRGETENILNSTKIRCKKICGMQLTQSLEDKL